MSPLLRRLGEKLQETPTLITGASGNIGHRLVLALAQSVNELRVLARNPAQTWPEAVVPLTGDLLAPETLEEACHGIHTIFHLASYSPARVELRPEEHPLHQQVTVEGTRNLIAAAKSAGVQRIIFASSTRTIDGSRSHYARCKRIAEELLTDAGEEMNTVVLRLSPVYGFAHQGFIAEMLDRAIDGRLPALPDFGDRRSMIHVEDVVQALLLVAVQPRVQGCWTVTDLQCYSMRRICEALQRLLEQQPARPWPLSLIRIAALAGEGFQRLTGKAMPLNLERLRKLRESAWFDGLPFAAATGFEPRYTLEQALPGMLAERQATPAS